MTFLIQIFWKGKVLQFQACKFSHVLNFKFKIQPGLTVKDTLIKETTSMRVPENTNTMSQSFSTYH